MVLTELSVDAQATRWKIMIVVPYVILQVDRERFGSTLLHSKAVAVVPFAIYTLDEIDTLAARRSTKYAHCHTPCYAVLVAL